MVTDTLSRTAKLNSPVIDNDQIADVQINDDELHQLKLHIKSLYFKQHQLPSGKSSYCVMVLRCAIPPLQTLDHSYPKTFG